MKSTKKIAVLAGDGIGPEVMKASQLVLEKVADVFGLELEFEEALLGHVAIEATGEPLPQATLALCRRAEAILLGAVGHPKYDADPSAKVRPEQGLLQLRKELELFANIRPIRLLEDLIGASSLKREVISGADLLFFRELTSGIYFGSPRERRENNQAAIDTLYYHRSEVKRITLKAFEAAKTRRKKVCSVDKANVLESSRLWREVVNEVAKDYPEVELTHMYIDNAAMQLIKNPKSFDVVLTGNMFGDILTDLASQVAGSLGVLPSASVGEKIGLYEPIHGSAPDIAGKDVANPIASILSGALMLEISFQHPEAAQAIRTAINQVLKQGFRTADIADQETLPAKILGTQAMTQEILKAI